MRYLITGGAGFIGSHLAEALAERGHTVVILDDLSTGRAENLARALENPQVTLVEGTILDADLVRETVEPADRCFHLASAVGVRLIVDRTLDALNVNARGTETVVDACAELGVPLLFTSSSEVYGKGAAKPLSEDADPALGPPSVPRWSYALAKAMGEARIQAQARSGGLDAIIVRLFNVVGPRQTDAYGMVLPRFVLQATNGEPLTVYGDGRQARCFVHVADTVRGLIALTDSKETWGRTFNLGSETEITIEALAGAVIRATGSASEVKYVAHEEVYGPDFEEPGRRMPDLSAIRSAVDWEPTLTLDRIIDDTIGEVPRGQAPLDGAVPVT